MGLSTLWHAQTAVADSDARLSVDVAQDALAQGAPDTSALLAQALPKLWDRIVPVADRARADALGHSSRMVARIIPGHDATRIEFNAEAVFAVLRDAGIPALVGEPRFHLLISVQNLAGQEQQQTVQMLNEEAARLAAARGIELSDSGEGLVLAWRWLDAQQAELSVRGQTRLGEFSETRQITDADALPALQAWLDDVLLRARDAYAFRAEPAVAGQNAAANGASVLIDVQRSGGLLQQVALEDALSRDPRVKSLLPQTLGSGEQRYTLQLEGADTSWLGGWFARRGYHIDRLPDGSWVVR